MNNRTKEKGVALLLALGFAALLLVLIMGFATNALIERKVAVNSGFKDQAKNFADIGLERAIYAMYYILNTPGPGDLGIFRFDNVVSKSDTSIDDGFSENELNSMFYEISDRYFLKYRDHFFLYEYPKTNTIDYNYNDNGEKIDALEATYNRMRRPQWQIIRDANEHVIGRFWYAVIPDMGRVYKGLDGAQKNSRKGQSVKEFDISMLGSFKADSDFEHILSWWMSDSDIADTAMAFEFFNRVEPMESTSHLNSKFRKEDNTFSTIRHLFKGDTDLRIPQTVSDFRASIPVIGTSEDNETVKNQIAANIIEAFRPLSGNVLSGNNSGDTDIFDDTTTYTGNRFTPYINEITLSLSNLTAEQVTVTKDETNPNLIIKTEIKNPGVTINSEFELYDIYNSTVENDKDKIIFTGNAIVEFCLYDTTTNSPISGTKQEVAIPFSITTTAGEWKKKEIGDFKYDLYYGRTGNFVYNATDISLQTEAACKLCAKIIGVEKAAIKYEQNGKIVDFVTNIEISDKENIRANIMTESINSNVLPVSTNNVISYQFKDPFSNLNASDSNIWKAVTTDTNIGEANNGYCYDEDSFLTLNRDRLVKIVADIKNANYNKITLADLQFVSRGKEAKEIDILGTDSPLLDQLTTVDSGIETKTASPQLIDINTRSVALWKGLFSQIKEDEKEENQEGEVLPILDDSQIEKLAKSISKIIRADYKFFKKRSDFIGVFNSAIADAGITLTKTQKIRLIGKIMSLCKTEVYPEFIYLIVGAQAIKDNPVSGDLKKYDEDDDEIIAEVCYLIKLKRIYDIDKGQHNLIIISKEELKY